MSMSTFNLNIKINKLINYKETSLAFVLKHVGSN